MDPHAESPSSLETPSAAPPRNPRPEVVNHLMQIWMYARNMKYTIKLVVPFRGRHHTAPFGGDIITDGVYYDVGLLFILHMVRARVYVTKHCSKQRLFTGGLHISLIL